MNKSKIIIIVISLAICILVGILAYLHYTNRLNYLFTLKWSLLIDSLKIFVKTNIKIGIDK